MFEPPSSLLDVARIERDRRSETYPQRIFAGTIDPNDAAIDFQCWVAITEWLETGRFASFYGGADPEHPDAPIINWPDLEGAAAEALAKRSAKIAALEGKPNVKPETLGVHRHARCCLFVIHRQIAVQRSSVEAINAEFHNQREGIAA